MPTPALRLVARALFELVRYDAIYLVKGFRGVYSSVRYRSIRAGEPVQEIEAAACLAVSWAVSLYYKPVRCLQRSIATTRLLRRYGINAELVIGCRTAPFFSHAWVEIDGRVVNDSQAYRKLLCVLARA